ncbi:MAG TPA: MATE family efflux transporter [Steroidobacteraceae bacterium]|nr:MATE family efflux transporter [Steroidobacteraceae bacterium]
MTSAAPLARRASALPAVRMDAAGRRHIDMRAVAVLALPLVLNSTVQAALNLTDTWFLGRLSTAATAAMAAVHWLALLAIFLIGGVAMGVQTLVAQAYGAGRYRRTSQMAWSGLWAAVVTIPAFALTIVIAPAMFRAFGLPPEVEALSLEFWGPRMIGGPLAAALWAAVAYFNGVGRTRIPLAIGLVVMLSNVVLNEILIFRLGWGMAGAAWATTAAELVGIVIAIRMILRLEPGRFKPHLTWRPRTRRIIALVALGLPMAMTASADLGAAAIFQLMQVRVGIVDGAATQIVTIFTAVAFMPGIGLALAGTTLVGQAIGAGDRDWAERLGNRIIAIVACFMGGIGIVIALVGDWVVPLFVNAGDPHAAEVIALCSTLLWIAAAYQFFDGVNFASAYCLRGAGDARVPALIVLACGMLLFLPLTHMLTFAPNQGWIDGLPAYGLGAVGGWSAILVYVVAIGAALWLRWRSGAWRRFRL